MQGVSGGFTRELDIVGIGYRADVKGKIATFTLGYSHPIEVLLPDGVDLKIDKQTHLVLTRLRPAVAGTGGREHPRASQAGSVQEQGHPVHGRSAAQEGRQDRGGWQMINKTEKKEIREPHPQAHPAQAGGHGGAAAPGGVPQRGAHLRAGHRRSQGRDAGGGSSVDKGGRTNGGNVAAAKAIGKLVAERAKEKGIKKVVFDRGGYQYHGRIKALADAAREAGLEF